MPIPEIESVDQLKTALLDATLHVSCIAGRDGGFVSAKDDPWSFLGHVSESLIEEAVAQGVLVESKDFCSCFDLAVPERP